jgi:hypothetical protein
VAASRVIEPDALGGGAPARAPLADVLQDGSAHPLLDASFGPRGAALVARALARFVERFPVLATADRDATLHAPCIEGVGDYPVVDGHLEAAPGVFVAGDACGRFRGIVASMVSGRYVGLRVSVRSARV